MPSGACSRIGEGAIRDGEGRAKTAQLTEQGRQAVENSTDAWRDAQARLLGRFGMKRWNVVEAALEDLVTISQEGMR